MKRAIALTLAILLCVLQCSLASADEINVGDHVKYGYYHDEQI